MLTGPLLCAWLCAKCFLCMISLNSHILINKVRFLSLLSSGGKERPREGRFLAQGHAGDGDRGLQIFKGFRRGLPPTSYALGPSNRSLARGRASPPLSVRQPSVWVSTRLQRCAPPQPPAPRRERQALAAPGPRPTPAADRRQRLRPRTPQRVSRSRRGKGAAPARGTGPRHISCFLAALCAEGKPSPSNQPSKMKKLQGAQLRKVGHEGGLAADLREGCRGPLPSRPRECRVGGIWTQLCRGPG